MLLAGWFSDVNSLVVEALRRYLETHRNELMERFIREDAEGDCTGMSEAVQDAFERKIVGSGKP